MAWSGPLARLVLGRHATICPPVHSCGTATRAAASRCKMQDATGTEDGGLLRASAMQQVPAADVQLQDNLRIYNCASEPLLRSESKSTSSWRTLPFVVEHSPMTWHDFGVSYDPLFVPI
eukprot:TRINITY_DN91053_c0_g1_i1.p1 TRINITY_DN91053_c0_g1~~TRINITY_DN91053_c0_g1_i1.p1  ORF type:complete len:119 (+),score=12.13 TRINITY_DN91053_c0_g1_i1:351-707(+)